MPFLFTMKEAILLALPLPWIFVPISPLSISFPLIGCLFHILCPYLRHLLPLSVIALLLDAEDLLALVLLLLLVTLVSIAPLGIPIACFDSALPVSCEGRYPICNTFQICCTILALKLAFL
jgi:hypothetical protein